MYSVRSLSLNSGSSSPQLLSLSDMLILALRVWSTSQGHLKNEEAIREGENMEGGINTEGADASAFRECFSLAWKNPYVLRLAFSAGIGGLLFGYDTGLIWSLSLSHLPSLNIMKEKDSHLSLSLSLHATYFKEKRSFRWFFEVSKGRKWVLIQTQHTLLEFSY